MIMLHVIDVHRYLSFIIYTVNNINYHKPKMWCDTCKYKFNLLLFCTCWYNGS